MNITGREQVGAYVPDNLLAGNRHPVDVCHVVIKAGENLKRGSLLEEDSTEPGKYVLRGTLAAKKTEQPKSQSETSETETEKTEAADPQPEYILADDVDATEEDTVGMAYRTGEFAENMLIVKEGYDITENDRKALRNAGIFLSNIMI